MLDAELVFDENCDDIRARSSHSASICFRRVQMKRSLTKTVLFHTQKKYDFTRRSVRGLISYFFTPEKSTILPVAPCETSYAYFFTPEKSTILTLAPCEASSYFFTPEKSTILPVAPCETSYRTFSRSKKVRFYPSLRAFSMTFNSVTLPVQI